MAYKNHRRPKKAKKDPGAESKKNIALAKKVKDSQERFLNAFIDMGSNGSISQAADEAGIDRSTHYDWMERDQEYAAKFIAFQKAVEERDKQVFILAYVKSKFSVSKAAEMLGIDRGKHYEWLKDKEYADRFKKTHDQMGDLLEAEGFRRAVEGWDEPVFKDGSISGYVRKYSDSILLKMLPALKPQYREKQMDIKVNNNISLGLAERVKEARERALRRGQENSE